MDDAHQVSKCLLKCPQGNSFDFSTIFSEFEVDSIVSFPLGLNWSDSYVLSTFSSWVINHVLLPFKWKKMQICCLSSCRSTCCRAVETWEALADIFSQEKKMRLWDVTWRNVIWICVAFCFEFWTFNLQKPYMLKWFGLCTWDAFYTNLTIGRLREILKIFTNVIHFCQYWSLSHYKYTLTPTYISFIFRGGIFFSEVTMYMSLWILRELHAHLITQPSKQTKHITLYHSYLFFCTKCK